MDLGKVSIEPNTNELFTMNIDVTKDYSFSVANNSNKKTSFRIFITLDDPQKVASTKKIKATTSFYSKGDTDLKAVTDVVHKFYKWYAAEGAKRNIEYVNSKGKVSKLDMVKVATYHDQIDRKSVV